MRNLKKLAEQFQNSLGRKERAYSKKLVKKTIGGKDIFKSRKDKLEEEKEERQKSWFRKKKRKSREREYGIKKRRGLRGTTPSWENKHGYKWDNLTYEQKKQFMEWYFMKYHIQRNNGKKPWTIPQAFGHVMKRIETISNSYFNLKRPLTFEQKLFVKQLSLFFGDLLIGMSLVTSGTPETAKDRQERKMGWMKPRKPSSWIIKFRYSGDTSPEGKGLLRVVMKRGKMAYPFYNFPYWEYILLVYHKGSLGKYWWAQWLWKYSSNPNKYLKFAYKNNYEKLEKFIGSKKNG